MKFLALGASKWAVRGNSFDSPAAMKVQEAGVFQVYFRKLQLYVCAPDGLRQIGCRGGRVVTSCLFDYSNDAG